MFRFSYLYCLVVKISRLSCAALVSRKLKPNIDNDIYTVFQVIFVMLAPRIELRLGKSYYKNSKFFTSVVLRQKEPNKTNIVQTLSLKYVVFSHLSSFRFKPTKCLYLSTVKTNKILEPKCVSERDTNNRQYHYGLAFDVKYKTKTLASVAMNFGLTNWTSFNPIILIKKSGLKRVNFDFFFT